MVTEMDITNATNALISFHLDLCEKACNGNADCIRKCHGASFKSMGDFIYNINPQTTSPSQLVEMIDRYKRDKKRSHGMI